MPGHGLHYACVLGSGLSKVRTALDDSSAFIEGWAQYAEAELRPDLPVGAQVVALQQRLLRAARAFLDPGLHLGRVTVDEALRVLTREVGASKTLAGQEVERYTSVSPVWRRRTSRAASRSWSCEPRWRSISVRHSTCAPSTISSSPSCETCSGTDLGFCDL